MNAAEQNGGKFQAQFPIVSKMRGKQKLLIKNSQSSTSIDKEDGPRMPLTMAIEETYSKGSLLDRIASLEDRLVQLCLEIESYKKSSDSLSTDKSSRASSSSGSKTERICSYPTFDIPNPQSNRLPRVPINHNVQFQENTNRQQEQQIKISSIGKQQHRGKKRDSKTGRNAKKNNIGPSWPHLKILGC